MKDNFSQQSAHYSKYRPHYPGQLYEFLYSQVASYENAWDCGTGNGQVAFQIARKFDTVYATDISKNQLAKAALSSNIRYIEVSAENSGLAPSSIDLITVAQALHWFDTVAFLKEVKRVARPDATMAYWGYKLLCINEDIDKIIWDFHNTTLGPYWDPERSLLLNEYATMDIALYERKQQYFQHVVSWNLDHLRGYLESWSAVQHYIKDHATNPVDQVIKELEPLWTDHRTVTFPIFLTAGKVFSA